MSLASLPSKIPFDIGGLVRTPDVKAVGFTGTIPTRIPFNLSKGILQDASAYGSVGWELICRAYDDFQRELLRTSDMNSLTFSKELSAFGAASFSLNLDHPLFQSGLQDGSPVETLFDYENLWEIRFDGQIVFQALGTAAIDSAVNDNEIKTATVSGSGIGKVLEWGQVFPTGFPDNIVTKIENLSDEFNGEAINQTIWKNTIFNRTISVTQKGMYEEADDQHQELLNLRENLTEDYNDKLADVAQAAKDWFDIKKDRNSTAEEKKQAEKAVARAQLALRMADVQLGANQVLINRVVAIKNFIGAPEPETPTKGHVKITLPDTTIPFNTNRDEPKVFVTSGTYDFEASGVSAAIEPGPSSPSGEGQINTYFQVTHDPGVFTDWHISTSNYAKMYTHRVGGVLRLAAEVSNESVVNTQDWPYDVNTQKYWRIREDNGRIIFETSPDNIVWTRRYSSLYSWPTDNVVFQFGMSFKGIVGIALPLSAYMYDLNKSALPVTETTMQIFRKYLKESQSRGAIPYVKTDFTDVKDSRGINWIGKLDVDVAEGTKLSVLLDALTQSQQADWIMNPDFTLRVFQRTKTDSISPPVYFLKDGVVFHEAGSQLAKERSRNRDTVANAIVAKNAAGQYAYLEDATSISKYQRREAFISAGTAADLTSLATVLDSSLEELKEEKTSWKVTVDPNQPGRRVFKDYDVGDWINIENVNSKNEVSVGLWRVVGIAINVATDATTRVELTLQSRRELLIERLKQQVSNLAPSSASGGTTIGSAISAATLIEQARLSGLKDVMVNNPVEGDVLTYSNGYWVPQAPGDNTVPMAPGITTIYTNVYYPADGVSTRGQAEISWSVPTNTDTSQITDGHHYELRFRPDVTADYSATWEEAGQYLWKELYNWAQPTMPPILNASWQTVYVPWGDTTAVIQELTPGMDYNIQIRAVDSSTPQHFSEWSEETTFSVAVDSIAPPKPAPPVVASSYLSIQVTHYLGRSDGGTFNLPPDMAYLEIHAGPEAFYPDDSTRIGKIIADQGLIRSGTPVIQSFNLDSTENIYVRVIAVDRTGNKSAPSNAVTATITLIDDAHISDLTASKITAGTISSSIILGGVIKTAESGARAEMNFEGFRIFSEDDDPTVSLLGSPGTNGNFLLIKDLEDPTSTLASIDGTGRGSFQSVYVNDNLIIDGDDLMSDIIEPRGKGVISIGTTNQTVVGAGVNTERGFMEISFEAEESRTYMISATTEWESDVANDRICLRLRDFTSGTPAITNTWIQQAITPSGAPATGNAQAQITYAGTFTPGLHRILLSFFCGSGVGTVNPPGSSGSPENTTVFWVEDVGLPKTDTVILNDGGVPAYQQTSAGNSPSVKREYTKHYSATWSGSYRASGGFASSLGSTMVQGNSGDSYLQDTRALCGFDYQQIMSDTRGATIKACYITMYASHWHWNTGGTAIIGTHNFTGRPSLWTPGRANTGRVTSANWPKPGKRKVSLGTAIGNEFRTGVSKGIALGPTNGTKTQYGKMNGNGQANEPVLTIVFVR